MNAPKPTLTLTSVMKSKLLLTYMQLSLANNHAKNKTQITESILYENINFFLGFFLGMVVQ